MSAAGLIASCCCGSVTCPNNTGCVDESDRIHTTCSGYKGRLVRYTRSVSISSGAVIKCTAVSGGSACIEVQADVTLSTPIECNWFSPANDTDPPGRVRGIYRKRVHGGITYIFDALSQAGASITITESVLSGTATGNYTYEASVLNDIYGGAIVNAGASREFNSVPSPASVTSSLRFLFDPNTTISTSSLCSGTTATFDYTRQWRDNEGAGAWNVLSASGSGAARFASSSEVNPDLVDCGICDRFLTMTGSMWLIFREPNFIDDENPSNDTIDRQVLVPVRAGLARSCVTTKCGWQSCNYSGPFEYFYGGEWIANSEPMSVHQVGPRLWRMSIPPVPGTTSAQVLELYIKTDDCCLISVTQIEAYEVGGADGDLTPPARNVFYEPDLAFAVGEAFEGAGTCFCEAETCPDAPTTIYLDVTCGTIVDGEPTGGFAPPDDWDGPITLTKTEGECSYSGESTLYEALISKTGSNWFATVTRKADSVVVITGSVPFDPTDPTGNYGFVSSVWDEVCSPLTIEVTA